MTVDITVLEAALLTLWAVGICFGVDGWMRSRTARAAVVLIASLALPVVGSVAAILARVCRRPAERPGDVASRSDTST